jgi:hypothetical protein
LLSSCDLFVTFLFPSASLPFCSPRPVNSLPFSIPSLLLPSLFSRRTLTQGLRGGGTGAQGRRGDDTGAQGQWHMAAGPVRRWRARAMVRRASRAQGRRGVGPGAQGQRGGSAHGRQGDGVQGRRAGGATTRIRDISPIFFACSNSNRRLAHDLFH